MMQIVRPLQVFFNQQVLEQNRRFYFVATASLGIHLIDRLPLLDVHYLEDVFKSLGENGLPDMGMPKPSAEFLVTGSYFSLNGQPVTGGKVKVCLDQIEKELYVFGPRKWELGMPTQPEPVTTMPVDYTKAFGGEGFELNPDGIGFKDNLLPCIENPKHMVGSFSDEPEPVGFGPLFLTHPGRMVFQGTYGADYLQKYFPGYPEDHNWKYFLCAPKDQQIKQYYSGNESFAIYNMHPEYPELKGTLPGFFPRCFLNRIKDGNEAFGELPLKLDTIWFFPDKLIGMMMWRGVLEVKDDEAEEISHVLMAYEDSKADRRTPDYYKGALEKRRNSDDGLLNTLNTQDLIPDDHKCAMVILMDSALEGETDSELAKNIEAKAGSIEKMVDEEVEKAVAGAQKELKDVKIPEDARDRLPDESKEKLVFSEDGLDIRKMIGSADDAVPDPDVDQFNAKLESILPGITSGDLKQVDMTDFSFEKIDMLMDATDALVEKKEKSVFKMASKEIETAKKKAKEQLEDISSKIEEMKSNTAPEDLERIKTLETSRAKIDENLSTLEDIKMDGDDPKVPLPRLDAEKVKQQMAPMDSGYDPVLQETMEQAHALRQTGGQDEKISALEEQVRQKVEQQQKEMADALEKAEQAVDEALVHFKDGYIMTAHLMPEGLSPHPVPLEDVRQQFLDAVSQKETVAGKDYACIDLSGVNLDGVNLSGAFLEQVNFTGASLRNADFSGAILARAVFDDADAAGAIFENANVGAVQAINASFEDARFTSAKLTKSNVTKSCFKNADLKDVEFMEVIVTGADFTQARMPKLHFMDAHISDAVFKGADLSNCIFFNCTIDNTDFTESCLEGAIFSDCPLSRSCFQKAGMKSVCMVCAEKQDLKLESLTFKGAELQQSNFQKLKLHNMDFSYTDLENACFGEADLSGSNLTGARARNAQFRKAVLNHAILDGINLDQGSLAKANLVDASFKGANLHAVDFLRSTITRTNFFGANLDTTLIENWRPE